MNTLFISYASDDQPVAMDVCALLEAQGVRCWIAPRDVAPGAKWDEAIVDAISNAGAFLLVLTAAANESPYVGNEVNHAFASKKPIFTFRAEDVQPNKSLGFYLARHHWTDGFGVPLPKSVPQVAAAVVTLLGATAGTPAAPVSRPARPRTKGRARQWVPIGATAVAVALLAGVAGWSLKPSTPASALVMRFVVPMAGGERLVVPLSANVGSSVVISPDGTRMAYVRLRGTIYELVTRRIDTGDVQVLSTAAGASAPFFSPDARWIGYSTVESLHKVPIEGGASVRLLAGGFPVGAYWAAGEMTLGSPQGLFRIPENGGEPRSLTQRAGGEGNHRMPYGLPDGRLLYTVLRAPTPDSATVVLVDPSTGEARDLVENAVAPAYLPTGHLVYVQAGTLFAVPFDLAAGTITGTGIPVVQGVLQTSAGFPYYSFSNTGTLLYVAGSGAFERRLVWVTRSGAEQALAVPARAYDWPRLSPDGGRVAVELDGQTWIHDVARGTLTRLTFTGTQNDSPAWTPDGTRIVVRTSRAGPPASLFWQRADGSGGDELVTPPDGIADLAQSFSPDGRFLAFTRNDAKTLRDIWVLSIDGRKRTPFLATPATEGAPRFSPDGRWMAYVSGESGRPEVYVQPFPGPGGKWQISTDGGIEPLWNPNGRELFYRNGSQMLAVPVETSGGFSAGRPAMLFDGPYLASTFPLTGVTYDVTRDGQRFLMVKDEPAAATQINVVVNWFEELKRLVPVP